MLAWLLITDAQSETAPFSGEPWWQYGAIGGIAAIAIYAVYKLFNTLVAAHKSEMVRIEAAYKAEIERIQAAHQSAIARADAAYDREVARGDRLEGGIRDLNAVTNDKLAVVVVSATDAIREALEMTRDRRRQ